MKESVWYNQETQEIIFLKDGLSEDGRFEIYIETEGSPIPEYEGDMICAVLSYVPNPESVQAVDSWEKLGEL